MTSFAPASQPKPTTAQHPVTPPPQQSQLVRDVAAILAAATAVYLAAQAIELLLKPWKIPLSAITAALGIANRGTGHRPRVRLAPFGLDPRDPAAERAREASHGELYFRAAYVVTASRRIKDGLDRGDTLGEAISKEARFYDLHEQARRERVDASTRVARAAALHGDLLGWYLDPLLNNEAECIAANGNNFYASKGTVIGLPGRVHPNCGCSAGPPHLFGKMVNDAVRPYIRLARAPVMFRLKKSA